jgi:hypothetical protein
MLALGLLYWLLQNSTRQQVCLSSANITRPLKRDLALVAQSLKETDVLLQGGHLSQAEPLAKQTAADLQAILQAWPKLHELTLTGFLGAGVGDSCASTVCLLSSTYAASVWFYLLCRCTSRCTHSFTWCHQTPTLLGFTFLRQTQTL